MNEEGADPFVLNDDINSTEFKEDKWTKNKKLIIGGSIAAVILVLIIIIIIIIMSQNSDNGDNEPVNDLKDKIGEIECIYDYDSYSKTTKILSDKFDKKKIKFRYIYR